MAQITTTKNILKVIGDTISPVVGKYYYLTRPNKLTDADTKHFAVIDMPTRFRKSLSGYSRDQTRTTGIIYVYSKAKSNNTPNIDDLTSLSEDLEKLFPIKGDGFSCLEPDTQFMGADDYGFQISRISFNIFIKKF